ncbi:MAG: nucleotidyltransferase family protein [Propionibacteriaceae bacterium]|nr:nucleotidyltransferase family protein [Propionibacteriaceae bacterium]
MTHLHARAAGVPHQRPTNDVDLVLLPAGTYSDTARALRSLGYRPHESIDAGSPFHRFARGADIVDVMASEGRRLKFLNRPVLEAPGTRSALSRTVLFHVGGQTHVNLPDIASALSVKGAAAQTDGLSRAKHIDDAITLFACASNQELVLSRSMRRHINHLITDLSRLTPWLSVAVDKRVRAVQTIRRIRPGWEAPTPGKRTG